VAGLSAVLSFGGFGLLLAVFGLYSAPAALLLGVAGTATGIWLGRIRRTARVARRAVHIPAAGMLLVAAGTAFWNAKDISHHVVADNDPGVYLLAGKWIARHGNLVVPGGTPWVGKGPYLNWWSVGTYPEPHATLQFQFAHLMPSLLAEAQNIGGDALMFRVPALLGAIGLCLIYAVGCRLISRPWLVLVAVSGLAVSLPQLYVSRDTFSESATEILLWGGIWLLLRCHAEGGMRLALLAGLAIGGTLMAHIDGVIYLVPLPLIAAAGWLAQSDPIRKWAVAKQCAAFVAGALPTAVLGTIDVQRHAGGYYAALQGKVHLLYASILGTTILAILAVVAWTVWPVIGRWAIGRRDQFAAVAAWAVAVVLIAAWALRPAGPKAMHASAASIPIGILQKSSGLPFQPNRIYSEDSLRWIDWYIGPVALGLAIAGLCVLVIRTVRNGSASAAVVLIMVAGITALYLWNPNLTPSQPWASRRYAAGSLPLFMLAAGVSLDAAAEVVHRRVQDPAWPRRIVAVGAAGLVAFPLGTSLPVGNFQGDAGYIGLVKRACATFGPNGAVLFPQDGYDSLVLTQTFRDWCNIPVATLSHRLSEQQLQGVSNAMRQEGKALWLVADTAASITTAAPNLHPALIGEAISPRELEQTLERPPQYYATTKLTIVAAQDP
jgi:hypothetical protein